MWLEITMNSYELLFLSEFQRYRVDAVAQPGGSWAIGENMSEVGIAGGASHLGSMHAVAVIGLEAECSRGHWLPVAGPSAARVVLASGIEQERMAAHAVVDAIGVVIPVGSREWRLGPRASTDGVLLRRQLAAPLGVRLGQRTFGHGRLSYRVQ